MTNNTWGTRFKQHLNGFKKKDMNNPLAFHVSNNHGNENMGINDFAASILYKSDNSKLTAIAESKCITQLQPKMNRKHEMVNHGFFH
jgi:hypothetical protein